jgi:hypothetical protein
MGQYIMPSHEEQKRLHRFCEGVIAKDPSIRFAGIANQMGRLIETAYREGLHPLMNRQDTEHYTVQTVLRASTRETFESKIGKQRYAIAVYEKLIRATIPLIIRRNDDNMVEAEKEQRQQKGQDFKQLYLLISFDMESDIIAIIEDKILPQIEQFERDSSVA